MKTVAVVIVFSLLNVVTAVSAAAQPVAEPKRAVGAKAAPKSATPTTQDLLVDRERRRLEELFIWKISEELKLPVELETRFADAIRSLNREKVRANANIAIALEDLSRAQNSNQAKTRNEIERAVRKYERALKTYGALPLREVRRMRSILGSERLGRYLIAKAQMTEKLKALSAREADESAGQSAEKAANSPAASDVRTEKPSP